MKVSAILSAVGGISLTKESLLENEARGCYCCDLLSRVMAKGSEHMAWVTVMTHMNVIAVAALHEMSVIILPEGIRMEDEPMNKAAAEGIAVLSSPLTAYEICGKLSALGL